MHICRKFVNVTIQALYPESFCMSLAVRKVLVFSDSAPPPLPPYSQAGRKGGGGVTPPCLTVSICENFDPFFPWNMIP